MQTSKYLLATERDKWRKDTKNWLMQFDRMDFISSWSNITMKNIHMDCDNFFDVGKSEKYRLVDFTFENINCTDKKMAFDANLIENTIANKVNITPREKSNGLKTTADADGLK